MSGVLVQDVRRDADADDRGPAAREQLPASHVMDVQLLPPRTYNRILAP